MAQQVAEFHSGTVDSEIRMAALGEKNDLEYFDFGFGSVTEATEFNNYCKSWLRYKSTKIILE